MKRKSRIECTQKGWNNKENGTKRQSLFGDVARGCPYQLFEQVGEVLR